MVNQESSEFFTNGWISGDTYNNPFVIALYSALMGENLKLFP